MPKAVEVLGQASVDLATAKKRWAAPSYSRATPSVDDANVYTWSKVGLVAIDRATGKERWHHKFEDLNWDKTIAIADDRVVTRADGKLVALAKSSGKVLWQFANDDPYGIGCSSPVIAGDVVLSVLVTKASTMKAFHAVDLASGKELWRHTKFPLRKDEEASLSWYCTPWVADDGTIFVQASGIQALR